MKIFLIKHNKYNLDMNLAHVIVANTISEVRALAANKAADEGELVWKRSAKVQEIGEYTGNEIKPFILMTENTFS